MRGRISARSPPFWAAHARRARPPWTRCSSGCWSRSRWCPRCSGCSRTRCSPRGTQGQAARGRARRPLGRRLGRVSHPLRGACRPAVVRRGPRGSGPRARRGRPGRFGCRRPARVRSASFRRAFRRRRCRRRVGESGARRGFSRRVRRRRWVVRCGRGTGGAGELGNVVGQDVVEGLDQQGAGQQALREFARTDLVGVEFGDPPFPGRVVVAGVQYGPAVQQFSGQRVVRAQRDAEHGCLTGLRSLLHGARGGARASCSTRSARLPGPREFAITTSMSAATSTVRRPSQRCASAACLRIRATASCPTARRGLQGLRRAAT